MAINTAVKDAAKNHGEIMVIINANYKVS